MSGQKSEEAQALRERIPERSETDGICKHGNRHYCGHCLAETGEGAVPPPSPSREELLRQRDALADALEDAISGYAYIKMRYGKLDGVGWDRVEVAAAEALRKAGRL